MFVSHHREKLINAIVYFVQNTKHCHTLKLFKLLNFLDFEHFRQTGRSVTGLTYKAWPKGPAPSALWHELDNPGVDLQKAVAINQVRDQLTDEPVRRDLKPKKKFAPQHFTNRELRIMEMLAFFYKETRSVDMSEVSHARDLPWGKVFGKGEGRGKEIPYELSFDAPPVLADIPSLSKDEYQRRVEAFREVEQHTT